MFTKTIRKEVQTILGSEIAAHVRVQVEREFHKQITPEVMLVLAKQGIPVSCFLKGHEFVREESYQGEEEEQTTVVQLACCGKCGKAREPKKVLVVVRNEGVTAS